MVDYRLYCFGGTGKIVSAEWLDAKSDDEAIAFARAKKLRISCELWERNRLVAHIPAHQPPEPAAHYPPVDLIDDRTILTGEEGAAPRP